MIAVGCLLGALLALEAATDAGPAAAPLMVTVTPARPRLLLGTDAELAVTIQIQGRGVETFAPARVLATVGRLEDVRASEIPGRFTGRYLPPAERFPQVALVVVELSSGGRVIHGGARITLDGSTVVPFRTSPGAQVSMRVGDRTFGPVAADPKGHVQIPIQVPPGVRTGLARAVDPNGATRETEVDLQLPPFPRIAVLAPAALEAGSLTEIAVFAVEPSGEPTAPARLNLTASRGLVHAVGPGDPGEARFVLEAPRRVGDRAVSLTASAPGAEPATAEVLVPLRPGPAAALAITPSTRRLIIGEAQAARIVISARDAFGNPTSAAGVQANVDGRPQPVEIETAGAGTFTIPAPSTFEGRERLTIEARLGAVRAAEEIHVTGGPPSRLTIEIRDQRLIADGRQGTEVRVRAVDQRGTPTMVPGLSWETPGGRVRDVRVPRDGEYIADYVPDRVREPRRDVVAVMASSKLRADAGLEVFPPPIRVLAAARAGLFHNLGRAGGPAFFVEALTPLPVRRFRMAAGIAAGYMRSDFSARGIEATGSARLETDQVPVLAVARVQLPLSLPFDLSADLAGGYAWASTQLAISTVGASTVVDGTAHALALGGGSELGIPLRPGRLVVGVRYLWINLGRTSQGDEIRGNTAGLIGDVGYRMAF